MGSGVSPLPSVKYGGHDGCQRLAWKGVKGPGTMESGSGLQGSQAEKMGWEVAGNGRGWAQGRHSYIAPRAAPEASRSSGRSGSRSRSTGRSRAHTRPWLGWAYRPMSSPRVWKRRTGTPCEVCRPARVGEASISWSQTLGWNQGQGSGSKLLPAQPGNLLHQGEFDMCAHASDT